MRRRAPRPPRRDDVLEALGAPSGAPDLTGRIMGRLGYMRAASAAARRHRRRRAWSRAVLSCLVLAGACVALHLHRIGPYARGVGAPSLEEAIGHDVDRHQQRWNRTIQWIRELAPVPPVQPAAPGFDRSPRGPHDLESPIDEDVDRSAIGPVRWL